MRQQAGNSRVHLANASVLPWGTKTDTDCALVAHVQWTTSCPAGLHVAYRLCDAVVPSIDKQGYTGVDDLCDERISFLVGSVCFELGKNVGIAVVDNGLGEAGDYRMKSAVHGRSLRCIHTAQMQRQKLLESHGDDVRCSG